MGRAARDGRQQVGFPRHRPSRDPRRHSEVSPVVGDAIPARLTQGFRQNQRNHDGNVEYQEIVQEQSALSAGTRERPVPRQLEGILPWQPRTDDSSGLNVLNMTHVLRGREAPVARPSGASQSPAEGQRRPPADSENGHPNPVLRANGPNIPPSRPSPAGPQRAGFIEVSGNVLANCSPTIPRSSGQQRGPGDLDPGFAGARGVALERRGGRKREQSPRSIPRLSVSFHGPLRGRESASRNDAEGTEGMVLPFPI